MMSFLSELTLQRRKFLDGVDANQGDINLDIFEDFYPDQAHFIFELLQNAEDAEASEAIFELTPAGCTFEHNGTREFSEANVKSITGIHNSTKSKATDQIGKFGVGFKSVFVYTLTPIIHSRRFSFMISRFVLPQEIDGAPGLGSATRFEFPFNSPKKQPHECYQEVRAGLQELSEGTLLFLSNITSIRWQISDGSTGELLRRQHVDNHIEVIKRSNGKTTANSHFLRFSEAVEGLPKQRVAVAFALDCLPNVTTFRPDRPLAKQLRIIPAEPGRVAVFFPAAKETSGLRFHLHAPFIPELSRASIKEARANEPLFGQLAKLVAGSLTDIRDLGLLTSDFLAVLPNLQDALPPRYAPIRSAIIARMNDEPLTPTHSKTHAPAKRLLQAKVSLKELLCPDDIEYLVDYDDEPPQWAIGASQRNSNVDRFLAGLAIRDWDIASFLALCEAKTFDEPRYMYVNNQYQRVTEPDAAFMNWLGSKPPEWIQELYSLLYRELGPDAVAQRLKTLRLVRIGDGTFSAGGKCFFAAEEAGKDVVLPCVDQLTYTSGKNKPQQEDARTFLEKVGVREIGEPEQIRGILDRRYASESFAPHIKDLKRFVSLVEKDPAQAAMFAGYFIFRRTDDKWGKPSQTCLDAPLLDTGLIVYYERFHHSPRVAMHPSYAEGGVSGVSVERLIKFAQAVGVRTQLEVTTTTTLDNPQRDYLLGVGGERYTKCIDEDYCIREFNDLVASPTVKLSKLIWETMCRLPKHFLCARYQKNTAHGPRIADSQLVHTLRNAAWVPQLDGSFVCPADADRTLLPKGFPFDSGSEWIEKMRFGQGDRLRAEQSKELAASTSVDAKALGFRDAETLRRARTFVTLPVDEQKRILADASGARRTALPDHQPSNPERRAKHIAQRAAQAPERKTETRERSVSVGLGPVKQDVEQYLRQQYTNADGEMICQICKAPLPFKLDDGNYFFEKVEFLPQLKKWYQENYLALCPNHSAMFQYAGGSQASLYGMFVELVGNELPVLLALQELSIYFTKTHHADLKVVLEVDGGPET